MASRKKSFAFLLRQAGIRRTPKNYMMLSVGFSSVLALFISGIFVFATLKKGFRPLLTLFIFMLIVGLSLVIAYLSPSMKIKKRKAEVESDLIYSVRHFLLKLDSGAALIQALEDVSMLPTVSSKYFAEVYYEIKMGTPIKKAVLEAIESSPSTEFRTVLEKIKSSILTGSDIKKSLKDFMGEMVNNKVLEIKRYGKKLGPATMMYMIFGTIVPSLGATMFVIATVFIGAGQQLSTTILIVIACILVGVQVSFYLLFTQMRPKVGF